MQKIISKSNTIDFYTVYPNGKSYNSVEFRVTIPCFNITKKNVEIENVYIYDASGNIDTITSKSRIDYFDETSIRVAITFDSTKVGRMLRIQIK